MCMVILVILFHNFVHHKALQVSFAMVSVVHISVVRIYVYLNV